MRKVLAILLFSSISFTSFAINLFGVEVFFDRGVVIYKGCEYELAEVRDSRSFVDRREVEYRCISKDLQAVFFKYTIYSDGRKSLKINRYNN